MTKIKSKKILVVDDEYAWRIGLQDILEDDGLETDTARSVNDAKDKIKEQKYDLIITDMRMPDRQGKMINDEGTKLCEHLDAHTPSPSIIALTVRDDQEIIDRCMSFKSVKEFLPKPVKDTHLTAVVRDILKLQK